jgi:hypothetical protein
MPFYWLCYRHNNQISVVIEPAPSLGMRAAPLLAWMKVFAPKSDPKWRVPKEMIGRRLSREEAKRLLAKLE